jgi:ATP phosphoribosyltransferase regulatory subunit
MDSRLRGNDGRLGLFLDMPGKSKSEREALEKQNAAIMAVFERAGFDYIAPDIIQPADIFLERSGEDIRARTFVFTDPSGAEMCLRPDLTVPACRYHLSHVEKPGEEAKYCYLGQAFRFPNERLSPQEFSQAGLEWFAAPNAAAAEARILKLTISALEATGLTKYRVTLGDLGLFAALLDDTPMPPRWRKRLQHHFWRPHAFRDVLESFTTSRELKRTSISSLIDRLDKEPALDVVAQEMEARDLPLVGGRSLEEIAARLADKSADRSAVLLDISKADAITTYLNIVDRADNIEGHLNRMDCAKNLNAARTVFQKRLDEMEELGLNPKRFEFKATFGRELEYYTGFVFQIDVETEDGLVAVAGGGRYDNLLSDMGSPVPVSAVGCAIHTERLKAVLA